MTTDPTEPLEAAQRANRALRERVADLERQLKRFADPGASEPALGTALSEREALLSEAERIAHMGSWVWDVVSNEVRWSDELFRILGYDPATHVASTDSYFDRVHPEDRPWVTERVARGIASGVSEQIDYRVLRVDGTVRYVKVDGALLFDSAGNLKRAVGTVLDVTEAREAAQKLARTAELLAEAQRIGKMGSFEHDVVAQQLVWSDELYRICDVDLDTAPSVELFLARIHEDDRPRIADLVKSSLTTGHVEPSRARLVHRDGSIRHVDMMAAAVRDPHGQLLAVRGAISDVTDVVLLEAQFHQSQKMEAVGQLAGGLAHDYNNLLMVISGNAELLLNERELPELREILSASTAATTLTNRLLTLSRQTPQRTRIVSLADDVNEATGLIQRALGAAVDLRCETAPDLWPVCVDSGQVQQVLLNLALNARDAMPERGVFTLAMKNELLDASRAALHGGRPGDYVTLSVTDTGAGMDAVTQQRAFEPFFTTKPPGRGTGLGLAMVFGTMKQCGGFVELQSQLGHGTTFRLWFPRADHEAPAPPGRLSVRARLRARVLLVEDNSAIRKVVERMIEGAGCSVRVASDPAEALRLWQTAPFDVLVTDVEMPGMSGVKLRERLCETTKELPTLFITGHSSERLDTILREGNCAVILKPFRGNELLTALNKLLDGLPRR